MFHFPPSDNTRNVAHRQASSSQLLLKKKNYPVLLGGENIQENSSLPVSPMPFKRLLPNIGAACLSLPVFPSVGLEYARCVHRCTTAWTSVMMPWAGPVKWRRNHTVPQNGRVYVSVLLQAQWLRACCKLQSDFQKKKKGKFVTALCTSASPPSSTRRGILQNPSLLKNTHVKLCAYCSLVQFPDYKLCKQSLFMSSEKRWCL